MSRLSMLNDLLERSAIEGDLENCIELMEMGADLETLEGAENTEDNFMFNIHYSDLLPYYEKIKLSLEIGNTSETKKIRKV